jgi:signal transduction histidine kinase
MNYNIAFGIVIALLFVSLVILFCVVLIKLYIQKIKNYNQIIYQKEIDHQISLNQTILETQEQTLQHISQELHDDAGQQITYINFQLENLKLDVPNVIENVNPISISLNKLSKSVRQLSHSLNNQILSQQDVIKAIAIETERLNANKNLNIQFVNKLNKAVLFSTHEKIVIYRVFQESINNILKHANATKIQIELSNESAFKMIITDNGKGFEVEKELNNSKSNGLQNMILRAKIINYDLKIESSINKGSKMTIYKNEKHG